MIRLIFLLSILYSSIFAKDIFDSIKNIIGDTTYKENKALINLLFKDKQNFIINDKLRYYKIVSILKKNGLLKSNLYKPTDIIIEFKILNNNFLGYKILSDTLLTLGLRYTLTNNLIKDDSSISWNIKFKSEYMLDPVLFLKELQQKNCKIQNLEVISKNHWYYEIDFSDAYFNNAKKIDLNEVVKFSKPLQEYFISIESGGEKLQIISRKLNRWFPYIVFFDKDLKILKTIKKDRLYKGIVTKIPQNTKYIKITDRYNLINIKRGLSIIIRGKDV